MKRLTPLLLFICSGVYGQASLTDQADKLLMDANHAAVIELVDKNLNAKTPAETAALLKNKKAEALIGVSRLQDAEQLLGEIEKSLTGKSANDRLLAITKINLGFLRLNQGRSDLAEELIKEALQLFRSAGQAESLEAAQAHANLGMVYISDGKYKQAEENLQQCLILRQKKLKDDDERIAGALNDLGLALSGTDSDRALDYYEQALQRYTKIHGTDHPKIAISKINIGILYRDMKLYGDAVNNFDAALKIWEKTYAQPHPSKAIALFNLGQTHMMMGDHTAARQYYEKALTMYQGVYGQRHPDIANVLNALGSLQLSDRDFAGALEYYQKALHANVSDFDDPSEDSNPSLTNYYNGYRLLQTLLLKAEAFESRYYGRTLKSSEFEKSLASLRLCDTLIDKLRRASNNEGDKLQLGTLATDVYVTGVRVAYAAGLNAFKKKSYFGQAFYFSEKSKGSVLQAAINESRAKAFAGIPPDLLEKEKRIKSALALNTQKLAQGPSDSEASTLRQQIFSLNQEYEGFIKSLEQTYPEYYNLKYNQSSPTIDQIQSSLDAGTAVLSYFTDDTDRRLYIFILTARDFRIVVNELPADFEKTLTGYRNSLYYEEKSIYAQTAPALSAVLLPKKMPGNTQRVVVIPTGRLGVIPFEPLLTAELPEEFKGYSKLPYFIRKYAVHYEFSASLMYQKRDDKASSSASSILLCAPVRFPAKDRLMALPGTRNEVESIAALFDTKSIDNNLFLDMQATEANVKKADLSKYAYLHFATHGIVDETDPELSRIYLQTNSTEEDGNLFAGEIYSMKLGANLVTLSACQTGLGKIVKGEGVIGLSRALVYAGAKHLIVSFWNVSDESTALLMKDFYEQLLNNNALGLGESLQKAKLEMISNDKYAAPYYWAPFILVGR